MLRPYFAAAVDCRLDNLSHSTLTRRRSLLREWDVVFLCIVYRNFNALNGLRGEWIQSRMKLAHDTKKPSHFLINSHSLYYSSLHSLQPPIELSMGTDGGKACAVTAKRWRISSILLHACERRTKASIATTFEDEKNTLLSRIAITLSHCECWEK